MKACLSLGFARYAWVCGQCLFVDGAGKKQPHCPNCDTSPRVIWRYVGQTIHGLRRSCVKYYQERGGSDAAIMKVTGHKTRAVFDSYSPADVESQRELMAATNPQKALPE